MEAFFLRSFMGKSHRLLASGSLYAGDGPRRAAPPSPGGPKNACSSRLRWRRRSPRDCIIHSVYRKVGGPITVRASRTGEIAQTLPARPV